jgi:hypothetical protein
VESDARPKVLFPCPACGAPHVLGPDTHVFQCRVCEHVTRFFYCRGCKATFPTQHDPAGEWGTKGPDSVRCGGCGYQTKTRALRAGRLVAARADWSGTKKFYGNFAVNFDDVVRFAGRRVIFGEVLSTSGIDGLEVRGLMVSFDRDALYVHVGEGYEVPYERIRLIEIASREQILDTPPRDVVATLVARTLAETPVSPSESVLAVGWVDGSFVLLNRHLRREELALVLEDFTSKVPPGGL